MDDRFEISPFLQKLLIRSYWKFAIFCCRLTPAGIYLHKVKKGNTRTTSEICSKLAIYTTESCFSSVLIVTFHKFHKFFGVSNVNFKQANAGWDHMLGQGLKKYR